MWRQIIWTITVTGMACIFFCTSTAHAEILKSSNFQLDNSQLGNMSENTSTSTSYGITAALGDLASGNTKSGNYQVTAGSNTTSLPSLAFSVNNVAANFGTLSASTTSTSTSTFSVRNYTTYGYVVQVSGTPPINSGHTIAPMNILGPSQTGIEQYGMNLVANTLPASLGSNPDNGQFGFGSVMGNYAVPNKYYYADGDIIAQALKDSGITNYTISYILNVAGLTPGGTYTGNQTLIVTGTY